MAFRLSFWSLVSFRAITNSKTSVCSTNTISPWRILKHSYSLADLKLQIWINMNQPTVDKIINPWQLLVGRWLVPIWFVPNLARPHGPMAHGGCETSNTADLWDLCSSHVTHPFFQFWNLWDCRVSLEKANRPKLIFNGWRSSYIPSSASLLMVPGDNCRSENVVRSLSKTIWSKHQQTKELRRQWHHEAMDHNYRWPKEPI